MSEQTASAPSSSRFRASLPPGLRRCPPVFNAMIDRSPALDRPVRRAPTTSWPPSTWRVSRTCRSPSTAAATASPARRSSTPGSASTCAPEGHRRRPRTSASARVEGWATWGEVDAATQEHGLAVTGGRVSTPVSAASRSAAAAAGSSASSGSRATTSSRPRWSPPTAARCGLRGREPRPLLGPARRRGNFGVVTAFHFRLHPIGPDRARRHAHVPGADGGRPAALLPRLHGDGARRGGHRLAFITAPPEEFVPEPVRGQPVVGVVVCYAGPVEEGEEAFRPLREFGPPAARHGRADALRGRAAAARPGEPEGLPELLDGRLSRRAPDEAVDVLVEHATKPVSPLTQVILLPGRRDRPGRRGRDRVRPAATPSGTSTTSRCGPTRPRPSEHRLHARDRLGDEAVDDRRALPELHRRRGLGRVEAAFGPEKFAQLQALKDEVGPDQPVPPQPEHPAHRRQVEQPRGAKALRMRELDCEQCHLPVPF